MSKLIPLSNFYKTEEKIKRKMGGKKKKSEIVPSEEIPTPTLIEPAKARLFSAVTALGQCD